MKNVLSILFALMLPLACYSQPVINNMLDYSIGMSIKTRICDTTNVQPGGNGANQHWMFTNLQTVDSLTTRIVEPDSTPYGATFPNATFATQGSNNSYTFIQKTAAENHMVGNAIASGPIISYYNPVLQAKRPFTFNDIALDTFGYVNPNMSGSGNLQMTADGYGTLHLPNGTFQNILRVKTIFHEQDTILTGPAFITTDLTAVSYAWYDGMRKAPLMTWDSTAIIGSAGSLTFKVISYLQNEVITGVGNISKDNFNFTAALSNSQLYIKGNFDHSRTYSIQLFTLDGRKLLDRRNLSHIGNSIAFPIGQLIVPGLYLLRISDNRDNSYSQKMYR